MDECEIGIYKYNKSCYILDNLLNKLSNIYILKQNRYKNGGDTMKKRIRQWAALCAAVGIAGSAVMGCGSSASKSDAGRGQTSQEAGKADGAGNASGDGAHIGIIFTEAGLGGNSFNDLALEGVKKAAADYGITYDEVEPKSVSDEEIIQDEMAASGDYDLIICVGAEQVDALTNVASTYPEQRFALLDLSLIHISTS